MKILNPNWEQEDEMHSVFQIRRFTHVSYSKNRDWKPVISQILTNVQEIFLVMWMLTVPTPLDHMYVHATLDTLEMDKLALVILISFLQCPEKSLLLFLYIQSQLFEAGSNLKRPTEHSIVGCDVLHLIPIRHRRVFKTEYLRWARLLQ